MNLITIMIILLVLSLLSPFLLFYLTKFTDIITIKKKYHLKNKNGLVYKNKYFVVNESDTVFNMANVIWLNDFNRAEDWENLKQGHSYKIYGYGFRLPLFNWNKNIYAYEEL